MEDGLRLLGVASQNGTLPRIFDVSVVVDEKACASGAPQCSCVEGSGFKLPRGFGRNGMVQETTHTESDDYEIAVRHGATWVRLGTAIFGPRN